MDSDKRLESIFAAWFLADSKRYNPKHRWFEVLEKVEKRKLKDNVRERMAVRNCWRILLQHGLAEDGKTTDDYPLPGQHVPVLYYKKGYTKRQIVAKLERETTFPSHMIQFRDCWMLSTIYARNSVNGKIFTHVSGTWMSRIEKVFTKNFNANPPKKNLLPTLVAEGKAEIPDRLNRDDLSSSEAGSGDSKSSEEEEEDDLPPPPKKAKIKTPSASSTPGTSSAPETVQKKQGESTFTQKAHLEPIYYPSSEISINDMLINYQILEWIKNPSSTKLTLEDRKTVAKATMFDWFFMFDLILDKGGEETHKLFIPNLTYFLGRCREVAPELELKIMIEIANYGNHPQWEDPNKKIYYMATNETFQKIYEEGIEFKCIDDNRWELVPTNKRFIASSVDIVSLFQLAEKYFEQFPELKEKLKIMMAPSNSYMREMLALCQNKEIVLAYGDLGMEFEAEMSYFCLDCLEDFEYSPFLPRNQILVETETCEHKTNVLLLKTYLNNLKIALQGKCQILTFHKNGEISTTIPDWCDEEKPKTFVQLMMEAHLEGWFKKSKKLTYENLICCKEFLVVKCPFCLQESAQSLTYHTRICSRARSFVKTKTKMIADLHARLLGATEPTVRLFFVEDPKTFHPQNLEVVTEDDHDGILIEALKFEIKENQIVERKNLFEPSLETVLEVSTEPLPKPISPIPEPVTSASQAMPPPPPPPTTTSVIVTTNAVASTSNV